MDLGLNFNDDDLQCSEKDTTGDRHVPYNVKICTNQWFDDILKNVAAEGNSGTVLDVEQYQKILKFSADFSYCKKEYQDAAEKYDQLLDSLTSKHNSALHHDARESLSRCYMYMGETEKGIQIASGMVETAFKEDEARQRQALALLSFAYEYAENWADCVDALEKLCEMQPQFPQTFHKLGDIYNHFLDGQSKDLQLTSTNENLLVKQLTCYLRAKFLFEAVMGSASEFLRNRNTAFIQQLTEKMNQSPLSNSTKKFASEFILKEVENQATSCKDSSSNGEKSQVTEEYACGQFWEKFCSWNSFFNR